MLARLLASIGAAALAATPLAAHHSIKATYDDATLVTLAGTVTSVAWRNPHTELVLETSGADGESIVWTLEIGAPNALVRSGIDRNFLVAGDTITVEAWTARDGTPRAHPRTITFADGRRFDVPEDNWMPLAASSP